MNKKALFLIIPFAAAGLVGCNSANPNPPKSQCDVTKVSINKTSLTLHVGESEQLVANANDGCTYSWSSDNETIASVSADGTVNASSTNTGVAHIMYLNANNEGVTCTVTVVSKEEHIHTFESEWTYDDDNHWHAATCGHDVKSEEGPHVDEDENNFCDVCGKDLSKPALKEYTPAQVKAMCDEAGSGKVVAEELIIKGVVLSGSSKSTYNDVDSWKGTFDGGVNFDSARTEAKYDSLDGCTVKIQGYAELYNGEYKIGYLPASASPTGAKYNPTLLSVSQPVQKEVKSVDSVKSHPDSVYVGGTIDASKVILNVTYNDETTGTVAAESVTCDTSVENASAEATAVYKTFPGVKFNIAVISQPVLKEYTPAEVKDLCDKAGSGKVVAEELIIKGVVLSGSSKSTYNNVDSWKGTFDGGVNFDSARTEAKYDSLDGCTVKIQGYAELYNGEYKIGYLPASASPTGAKYNPSIVSVVEPVQKEVKSVDSVQSHPDSVYVGGTIDASKVILNVTYNDETTGTVAAESVTCDTSVENASAEATAVYKTFPGVKFNIAVVAKPAPAAVNVEYNITTTATEDSSTAIEEAALLEIFKNSATDEDIISSASSITKIYEGKNSLKFSSNKADGSLTLGLKNNVTTVVLEAYGKSDTVVLSVNGVNNTIKTESASYEFVIEETDSVVIASTGVSHITYIGFAAKGITPVTPEVKSVAVLPKSVELVVDGTKSLTATVDAVGGAATTVNWSSNDEAIATVDANGVVTAHALGDAVITATSTFDATKSDTCAVSVVETPTPVQELDSIEIKTAPTKTVYNEGESFDKTGLEVTAHYTNGKADATISADDLVCTPSGALKTTDSVITVSYTEGEITKTCEQAITVNPVDPGKGTTEDNPFNADEAYAYAESLGSGNKSESEYYIKGAVTKIETAYSSTYNNITLQLTTTTSNIFKLYRVTCTQEQADEIVVGTVVEVKGYIYNYSGTVMETDAKATFVSIVNNLSGVKISGNSSIKASEKSTYTASPVPSVASLGEVTWSIEEGDSYISLPETKTGTSIEVTAVAVGTATIKATCGDFSDEFEITVTDPSAIDPYEATFSKNTKGNTDYSKSFDETIGDITWSCQANNTVDDGIKLSTGKTTTANDRTIYSKNAFTDEASKFVVVTGKKDAAAVVNSVKLYVYPSLNDLTNGTNVIDTIDGAYEAESKIEFNKPTTSDWNGAFFKVVFNLGNTASGSNNGIKVIGVKVEF